MSMTHPEGPSLTKTQQAILTKLKASALTIQEIADAIGFGYHAARNNVLVLQKARLIEESGILRNRSKVFMLVNTDIANTDTHANAVPTLYDHSSNIHIKALVIIGLVGREQEMASVQANLRLPGNIAQLLYIAMMCNKGLDQTEELYQLRQQMQRDYVLLNNAMQFIKQILDNPEWWDQKYLKNMPLDKDYHFPDVREAYRSIKGDSIL